MHFVNTNRSNKVVIYFESSSICVHRVRRSHPRQGGGSTSDKALVRSAACKRSDRRRQNYVEISIDSRVTFISAKSFWVFGFPNYSLLSGRLGYLYSILQKLTLKNESEKKNSRVHTSAIYTFMHSANSLVFSYSVLLVWTSLVLSFRRRIRWAKPIRVNNLIVSQCVLRCAVTGRH